MRIYQQLHINYNISNQKCDWENKKKCKAQEFQDVILLKYLCKPQETREKTYHNYTKGMKKPKPTDNRRYQNQKDRKIRNKE